MWGCAQDSQRPSWADRRGCLPLGHGMTAATAFKSGLSRDPRCVAHCAHGCVWCVGTRLFQRLCQCVRCMNARAWPREQQSSQCPVVSVVLILTLLYHPSCVPTHVLDPSLFILLVYSSCCCLSLMGHFTQLTMCYCTVVWNASWRVGDGSANGLRKGQPWHHPHYYTQ